MNNNLTYIMIGTRKKPLLEDGTPDHEARSYIGLPAVVYAISAVKDGIGKAPYYEVMVGKDGVEKRRLEKESLKYAKLEKLVGTVKHNVNPDGTRCRTAQRRLLSNRNPGCRIDESEVEEIVLGSALYTAVQILGADEVSSLCEQYLREREKSETTEQSSAGASLFEHHNIY